ncbi:unnamed protein product [Acanthoscelides obtectus]|uniref:Uncharacterized protein n=1 Tax=Acanthoscelides obtectus TaxID=200917 RepID=A0A9P0Q0Z7_ACAOB|nr:unnamed protein product [Acanthoscelides obtectus]CAH2006104.1 unnamed protein product [Acanthoscelides obtectus]CAK1674641.1 hypothetical protein AOBTE_LOCUS29689 [Acanthoscelides obtectus]CAK1674673.1 hypothetical protein AOBTE_LOCUS29700 [Acanthoscelides obtectus]
MKTCFVIFCFALIAIASAAPSGKDNGQEEQMTQEQVAEILKYVIPPWVTCVNLNCRLGCIESGAVSGYCAAGSCQCVIPSPTA